MNKNYLFGAGLLALFGYIFYKQQANAMPAYDNRGETYDKAIIGKSPLALPKQNLMEFKPEPLELPKYTGGSIPLNVAANVSHEPAGTFRPDYNITPQSPDGFMPIMD